MHIIFYLGDLLDVPEENLLIAGYRGGAVVVHQLVQRVKLYHPQEILSSPVTKDLEMLNVISKPAESHREQSCEALTTRSRYAAIVKSERQWTSFPVDKRDAMRASAQSTDLNTGSGKH